MKTALKSTVKAPVRLYTALISPLIGPRCRFQPTCSAYTLEAIETHGVAKGLFLGLRRLLRCHPWAGCRHFDPVPAKFDWSIDLRRLIRYKREVQKIINLTKRGIKK